MQRMGPIEYLMESQAKTVCDRKTAVKHASIVMMAASIQYNGSALIRLSNKTKGMKPDKAIASHRNGIKAERRYAKNIFIV